MIDGQKQNELRQRIGANLRRAREAMGWSRRRFESETGISQVTVRHWEHGDCCPPLDVAVYLSGKYGVSLKKLVGMKPGNSEVAKMIRNLLDASDVQGPGSAGDLMRDAAEQLALLDERIAIMMEGRNES